jgi:hypothetical protein
VTNECAPAEKIIAAATMSEDTRRFVLFPR